MKNSQPRILPPASFVSFEARRLSNSRTIWRNEISGEEFDIDEYHFSIPTIDTPAGMHASEFKTFLAERYGGRGVGTNGGGVRCGVDGNIQIKGIGRNCLAGMSSDIWHTHGGANLHEGICEAIWGEVCHNVLPHGGVRALGIIHTGMNIHIGGDVTRRKLPQVLILRQFALRPAHFMRSVNFDPMTEVAARNFSDTERTMQAVKEFDVALTPLVERKPKFRHDPKYINDGLIMMIKRFATQIANARAKRLPHGALNCSNIALDGRYIDFGTMSAISDNGRIITAAGNPDLWYEHTNLSHTIIDLLFYLRNYLPKKSAKYLIGSEELLQIYNSHLGERLAIEFLKLTGIPEVRLIAINLALRNRISKCIQAIISAGNAEPFKLPQMPEKMGTYHLNKIFIAASLCDSKSEIETEISELLPDTDIRRSFAECYNTLVSQYFTQLPLHRRPFARIAQQMNCLRLNSSLPRLYHPQLQQEIEAKYDCEPDLNWVSEFIESRTKEAIYFRAEASVDGTNLSRFFQAPLIVGEAGARDGDNASLSIQEILGQLSTELFSARQRERISRSLQ